MSLVGLRPNCRYLLQETLLIVVLSYLLFFGGTLNGLVVPQCISVTLWLVGGVSVAWLAWHALRRQWVATPSLWLPVLAVVLAHAVTGCTSLDPRRSLDAMWALMLEVWVCLLVYDLVSRGWPAELFVKVLLILGAIVVVFALWQLLDWARQWLEIAGWEEPVPPIWLRPGPFYSHANLAAAFVNLLWPLALMRLWESRARLTRLWCGLLIAGCGVVVAFSSSRGALLGAGGALVLMVSLALGGHRRSLAQAKTRLVRSRWRALLAAIGVVGAGGVASLLLLRLLTHPGHGPVWGSRTGFWQAALNAFRRSPLVGSGPGTFASDYLEWISVPPSPLYLHAHSMPMQLAAEMGLTGLLAATWLVLALAVMAYRRWRAARPDKRYLIVGLCGALTALGLHGLVDVPTSVPAIAMVVMMLLALLLVEPAEQSAKGDRRRAVGTVMSVLAALVIAGGGAWMQYAYRPYFLGAAYGNTSAWADALPLLEEATRRDPGHAYYHAQAGFACGMVAFEGDLAKLPMAIAHYRQAIDREASYSLNHANLAVLLWQQGEHQAAMDAMQRAAELAPGEPAYPLNLGVFYEAQGDGARALEFYRRVLTSRPDWAAAYFWRSSDVRGLALREWKPEQPSPPVFNGVQVGAAGEALAQFDQAIDKNPTDPEAYLGRALALIALERWEEAEQALRTAEFVALGYGAVMPTDVHAEIIFYQTVVMFEGGRRMEAICALERVLGQVRDQSLFGPGGGGAATYGWGVFHRVGWGRETLPGLQVIRFTDTQVGRLLMLGQWYESVGDLASARRVYEEALEIAPDTTQAAERLAALEGK